MGWAETGAAASGKAEKAASHERRVQSPCNDALFCASPEMLSDPGIMCKHCAETASLAGEKWGPPPVMHKIMIIRHAEKHQHGMDGRGVDADGRPARHELTVRGWQRAGALVRFFTAPPPGSPIQAPRAIFASDATRQSPSLRAMHTAGPLAEALGITVNHEFAEGQEATLAAAACAAPSPVLIVWHHGRISRLAQNIGGGKIGCPGKWPDDIFDRVWILERMAVNGAWRFSQVAQHLLPGDHPEEFCQ